ncbi:MAG: glycosyltransferase family 2 protein [Lachnospiraceae bacterium]|nr:glycosyltransferase family 2 protein [Lachnospiraceae bacterium]
MSEVTVIIPNYNGDAYIENCLQSLKKQTFRDFEILIIDNASEDHSADYIVAHYPEIPLIRLSQNFGFSRAVNEGIKRTKSPYLILLNNDTVCDPHFVEELYQAIAKDKKIFSVSSKMLQMYAPEKIDGAGDLYCALGWAFARGKDRSKALYEKESKVFSACAGAAIYRRDLFEQIGYFDEFHFTYLEDVDVGYRARIMGYENRYTPKAIVYHAGSGATGSRYNPFKVRIAARNSWYVIYKNMPALQIFINLPFLLIGFGIKALFFICKGYGREYLSGMKRGYLMCVQGRKFPFSARFLPNYLKIQLELWINMFRRLAG